MGMLIMDITKMIIIYSLILIQVWKIKMFIIARMLILYWKIVKLNTVQRLINQKEEDFRSKVMLMTNTPSLIMNNLKETIMTGVPGNMIEVMGVIFFILKILIKTEWIFGWKNLAIWRKWFSLSRRDALSKISGIWNPSHNSGFLNRWIKPKAL